MNRIALTCTLAFAAVNALAQPADGDRAKKAVAELQKRFTAADVNGDGRLTRDEARAGMPKVYQHFDEIDTAHSGAVTLADIGAYLRSRRGERKTAP